MTSKQFCLKWNNFQSNILNAFESLQNTEDLTDVTLTCEGINVKAHKFILSACSPYFRTVFKENPCSHPIIILKDVFYADLVAIINFMYHGEVLVSEEQLASFLQTAKLLQVSGLNNTNENFSKRPPKKKIQKAEIPEHPLKRVKISNKPKLSKVINSDNQPNSPKEVNAVKEPFSLVQEPDKIKTSSNESDDEYCADVNENVEVVVSEKTDPQGSILEAALEKPESILERSLTSQPGKSPSSLPFPPDQVNLLQVLPDVPKSIFIPRKPPELELEKRAIKPTSSGSSSPSTFDRPSEFLQQTIKIEEDSYDSPEPPPDDIIQKEGNIHISRAAEVQPHHSSQCGNCPHCGKVYSNQSALKYHVRLVHSDLTNMYCCHLCPEAFNYREGYKKHMVEVHCIRN
ncbi:longitudinals lacking protein, isoforms H/M/V [Asbolus verrucosus]|uniref:Longitudinals lacking protein, isoforms H/M/V n=1 Tax=Asbolus verrucosus TaxID=1661398 RepID=A0A482VDP7_ASBVE|nr:longitudinals lacking protein, isoforms H/M/V [Asbolus verrucosus]